MRRVRSAAAGLAVVSALVLADASWGQAPTPGGTPPEPSPAQPAPVPGAPPPPTGPVPPPPATEEAPEPPLAEEAEPEPPRVPEEPLRTDTPTFFGPDLFNPPPQQGWLTLTPSFTLSGEYNDNIFLSDGDEESDFSLGLTPGLTVSMQ